MLGGNKRLVLRALSIHQWLTDMDQSSSDSSLLMGPGAPQVWCGYRCRCRKHCYWFRCYCCHYRLNLDLKSPLVDVLVIDIINYHRRLLRHHHHLWQQFWKKKRRKLRLHPHVLCSADVVF